MSNLQVCSHAQDQSRQVKLQLTNGYYLHFDQISRLLHYIQGHPEVQRFSQLGLAEGTGLTDRQIESLGSIVVRLGLLRPRTYCLTPFGKLVLSSDVFFDRVGTLWFCHYYLASDTGVLVWNHMVNCVMVPGQPVTTSEARATFQPFLADYTARSSDAKLMQELRSFFNAYTEQSFRRLNYLQEIDTGIYALADSPAPVPIDAFLACLLLYRDRFQPGASGLEISTVCSAEHGPGRLLHLSEMRVRTLLNELHRAGRLTIESQADLDQVRFRIGQTWLDAVRLYYEEQ